MSYSVDLTIPFANAGGVDVRESGDVVEVAFSPHPHGGPECLWFCFRVVRDGSCGQPGATPKLGWGCSAGQGESLDLLLENVGNMLGGRSVALMRPVARYAGGDWERLGPGVDEDRPDGRRNGRWRLAAPDRFVDVAFCYPYGKDEVDALVAESNGAWRRDVIGLSQAGRPLVRLSNGYGDEAAARPGIYVVARQHSAETPGSWVLDGLLRRMAALGDAAPLVWAVPLGNIDGVEQGDYGKDNFPYDVNRAWGRPTMRHETLVMQRDIARWRKRCRPFLCLDFHAPGACETKGIYMFLPNPEQFAKQHESMAAWTAPLSAALGEEYAAETFGVVATYVSRWETPNFSRFAFEELGVAGVTLETPYSLCRGTLMTRDRYREAGRRIADGVAAAGTAT